MRTRWMVLSSLLVAASALPARSTPVEPLDPLVRDVLCVYFRVEPDEGALRRDYENIDTYVADGSWDEKQYQQRQLEARAAWERFAALPRNDLLARLTPLLSQSAPGNATYVSAAYVLARRGVDVEANVGRMASTLRLPVIEQAPLDRPVMKHVWPSTVNWLPERMADVYLAQDSPTAVQALLPENCRPESCERFRAALVELTASKPEGVLRAAQNSEEGIDRLTRFLRRPGGDPARWNKAMAALGAIQAPDIQRAAWRIRGEAKALTRIRQCMLLAGGWDSETVHRWAKRDLKDYPDSPRSQALWRIYNDAVDARRTFDSMPKGLLRRELVPLFSRLTRSGVPYVSVAWVLAGHGVDGPVNVERATSVVSWLGDQPYPDLSDWERDAWTHLTYDFHAVAPEDWPMRLADLYRKTRDTRLLDTLLTAPVILDGAMATTWTSTVYDVAREFPEHVIRTVSRSERGADRLISILTHREFEKAARDAIRPALKRIAAGKDGDMARVARRALEAMDETGRRQDQHSRR